MENVLSAFIVFFLILFLVLTMAGAAMQSQDMLQEAWGAMEQRLDSQTRTHLVALDAYTMAAGSRIRMIWRNGGTIRLLDFDRWDVIAQYYDSSIPPALRILRTSFSSGVLAGGQWEVSGIFLDAAAGQPELFEPSIVNPGEELVTTIAVVPPVGAGQGVQVVLSTEYGTGGSISLLGNYPPVLVVNSGMLLAAGASAQIGSALLAVSDQDDPPETLVYTVTAAPQQGSLSLGSSFTQDDIDAGLLSYTHTGSSGTDGFSFTVSDGKDEIGETTFVILVSAPPALTVNTGLGIPGVGTWTIGSAQLTVSDPDDLPADLRYTVTVPPLYGSLSLGSSFTQDDLNQGLLTYTVTGTAQPDQFQFIVSDGESTIGAFSFILSVP